MKRRPHRIALSIISAGVCLVLTGCFSYTKEQSTTPAVEVPSPAESSTTTTTTSADNGVVQREHSTTTTFP